MSLDQFSFITILKIFPSHKDFLPSLPATLRLSFIFYLLSFIFGQARTAVQA
jgi:hypothetical protein